MFFGSYLLHQESNCAEYHIRASSMDRAIPIGPSLSRSNQPNDDPEPEETHPWEKDWYVPSAQPDVQQTAATQPLTSEGMGPTAPRWGQRTSQSSSQIYDLPVKKAPTPHIQPQDRTGSHPPRPKAMTPEQMDLFRTPPKPKPPTLKAPPPPVPSASSGQDDLMRLAQDRLAAPFRPIRSGDLVVPVRDLQRKDSACPRPGSVYKVVKMHALPLIRNRP